MIKNCTKKVVALILAMLMVIACTLTVSAVDTQYRNNTVRVKGNVGSGNANTPVVLLMLDKDADDVAFTTSDVYYAEQIDADKNGDYLFKFKTSHSGDYKILVNQNGVNVNSTVTEAVEFKDVVVPAMNITKDGMSISLENLFDSDFDDYEMNIMLAGYDKNKRMTGVRGTQITATGEEIILDSLANDLPSNTVTLKAFLWGSLETAVPLTNPVMAATGADITCIGDSLTQGVGSTNESVNSYPAVLSKLTAKKVNNLGVSGETATTIAARAGAVDMVIQKAFTIPASASESVTVASDSNVPQLLVGSNGIGIGPRTNNTVRAGYSTCIVKTASGEEIECNLDFRLNASNDSFSSMTLTRLEDGDAVNVAVGDKIIPYAAQNYKDDITVIWSGTNGKYDPNGDKDTTYLINLITDMTKTLSKGNESYVVIGLKSKKATLEEQMKDAYGDKFINIREYFASGKCYEDAVKYGYMSQSEADAYKAQYADAMAAGQVPAMFDASETDRTHFNDLGYKLIAHCVHDKLLELGYCYELMD